MTPFDEVYAEANGRAIAAFLRAMGGEAEVHARDFGLKPAECSRAVRRLKRTGRAEPRGNCVWRLRE